MSTNQKTISAEQDRAYELLKRANLHIMDVVSANENEETKRYAIRRAEQLVTRAKKLLDSASIYKDEDVGIHITAEHLMPTPNREASVAGFDVDSFVQSLMLGGPVIAPGTKFRIDSDGLTTVDRVQREEAEFWKGFWKRKCKEAEAKLGKQTATLKNTLEQLSKVEALVCDAHMGTVCLEHNLDHKLKMNPQVKKPPSVNLWYAFTAIADEKDALKAALAES